MELHVETHTLPIKHSGLIHVLGVGAELPFESKKSTGERRYYRDEEGNPGAILTIKSVEEVLLFGMNVEMTRQYVMNASTAGRGFAILHEIFERIGQGDAMHAAIGRARNEVREAFQGVDFAEHWESGK